MASCTLFCYFPSNSTIKTFRDAVQKQQSQAIELAKRRFFIPAVRTLMGAIYDARYLHSTQMIATGDLTKLLEANRDVRNII